MPVENPTPDRTTQPARTAENNSAPLPLPKLPKDLSDLFSNLENTKGQKNQELVAAEIARVVTEEYSDALTLLTVIHKTAGMMKPDLGHESVSEVFSRKNLRKGRMVTLQTDPSTHIGTKILKGIHDYIQQSGIILKLFYPASEPGNKEYEMGEIAKIRAILKSTEKMTVKLDWSSCSATNVAAFLNTAENQLRFYDKQGYVSDVMISFSVPYRQDKPLMDRENEIINKFNDFFIERDRMLYSSVKDEERLAFPGKIVAFLHSLQESGLPDVLNTKYETRSGKINLSHLLQETDPGRFRIKTLDYIAALPKGNLFYPRIIDSLYCIAPNYYRLGGSADARRGPFVTNVYEFHRYAGERLFIPALTGKPSDRKFDGAFALALKHLDGESIGHFCFTVYANMLMCPFIYDRNNPATPIEEVNRRLPILQLALRQSGTVNGITISEFFPYKLTAFLGESLELIYDNLNRRFPGSHLADKFKKEIEFQVKETLEKSDQDSQVLLEEVENHLESSPVKFQTYDIESSIRTQAERIICEKQGHTPICGKSIGYDISMAHLGTGIDDLALYFPENPLDTVEFSLAKDQPECTVYGKISSDGTIHFNPEIDSDSHKSAITAIHMLVVYGCYYALREEGLLEGMGATEPEELIADLMRKTIAGDVRITYKMLEEYGFRDIAKFIRNTDGIRNFNRAIRQENDRREKPLSEEDANQGFMNFLEKFQ